MESIDLLKRSCPSCESKVFVGWKYCGNCGHYIGNHKPRIELSGALKDLEDLEGEEGSSSYKVPAFVNHLLDKTKEVITEHLDRGEEISNPEVTPLIFQIWEKGPLVYRFQEDFSFGSENIFSHDEVGYYFLCSGWERTFINSKPVERTKKNYLTNGDFVTIGNTIFIFSILKQEKTKWHYSPIDEGLMEKIGQEEFKIQEGSKVYLDGGSNSEVYVNNNQVCSRIRIKNGDVVVIGNRHFVFLGSGLYFQEPLREEEKESLALNIHQVEEDEFLEVSIKERSVPLKGGGKRCLLRDIDFIIQPGEMVLILGGSGAGKTTLINAIMGSEKADAKIKIGNYDLYKDFNSVRRMISLVPQFNLHRPKDTVYMTLKNAGQLKLPREFVRDQRLLDKRIEEILDKLSLRMGANSLVSALSGGEKKRLSIATEYISDPVLFILDEPDSGVDGSNARTIMNNLRTIANDNKMVLLISHNPDRTWELFDKVIVLAKSEKEGCGRLAFFGSVEQTLDFFETGCLELVVEKVEKQPDHYIHLYEKYRKGGPVSIEPGN